MTKYEVHELTAIADTLDEALARMDGQRARFPDVIDKALGVEVTWRFLMPTEPTDG